MRCTLTFKSAMRSGRKPAQVMHKRNMPSMMSDHSWYRTSCVTASIAVCNVQRVHYIVTVGACMLGLICCDHAMAMAGLVHGKC